MHAQKLFRLLIASGILVGFVFPGSLLAQTDSESRFPTKFPILEVPDTLEGVKEGRLPRRMFEEDHQLGVSKLGRHHDLASLRPKTKRPPLILNGGLGTFLVSAASPWTLL